MATRNYTNATKYESTPEQIHKRSLRNQARRAEEKRLGHKLPSTQEVDHIRMIKDGGGNTPGNTRVISEHQNTAWRKGRKGYK